MMTMIKACRSVPGGGHGRGVSATVPEAGAGSMSIDVDDALFERQSIIAALL